MSEITSYDSEQEPVTAEEANDKMSLVDHLQELRKRLITAIIAVAIGSLICYFYAAELVHLITAPAGKLYYMNPSEAFFSQLRVSFFVGFFISITCCVISGLGFYYASA